MKSSLTPFTQYVTEPMLLKMKDWFMFRTQLHIDFVNGFYSGIQHAFPEFGSMDDHDASKFEEPEYTPYLYISWTYKCRDEGWRFEDCNPPDNIDDLMHQASMHHVLNNNHHPEAWAHPAAVQINLANRDASSESIIDGTKMPDNYIGEMVADWCAISKERNSQPRDWADANINVRWKFSARQVQLIYHLIDLVWVVEADPKIYPS